VGEEGSHSHVRTAKKLQKKKMQGIKLSTDIQTDGQVSKYMSFLQQVA
jgi:hypothetical protein